MKHLLIVAGTLAALVLLSTHTVMGQSKPLRVFILAGQSNMEGHAKIETFDYIGDDPETAPLLQQMRGADGNPTICEGAWISYFTGSGENNGEGHGKLTAGYGSRRQPDQDGGKIGPEFTFGITMDATFDQPVLIIKTKMTDKSVEIRQSAIRAAVKHATLVPNVIALLTDASQDIRAEARQALKTLSKTEDFGPDDDATPKQQEAAQKKWQAWWKKKGS